MLLGRVVEVDMRKLLLVGDVVRHRGGRRRLMHHVRRSDLLHLLAVLLCHNGRRRLWYVKRKVGRRCRFAAEKKKQ